MPAASSMSISRLVVRMLVRGVPSSCSRMPRARSAASSAPPSERPIVEVKRPFANSFPMPSKSAVSCSRG